jgi:hypothetical protein
VLHLDQLTQDLPLGLEPVAEPDAAAARRSLRAQVARLERQLSETVVAGFPHAGVDAAVPGAPGGPRLLSLGELEALRDDLAQRVRDARRQIAERRAYEAANRELLERMFHEPRRHKFVRLRNTDLGERGCGVYEVRPRVGLIGMLMGWWQVKLSSGCPLPKGRTPPSP